MEILKLLNGTTEEEIKSSYKAFVSWDRLHTSIEDVVMLRPDETIKAYAISETGINVSIGRKPGRKTTVKDIDTS